MYSISYLRRQVDALQRRIKPVLTILRLRNLATQLCDEFDKAASAEPAPSRESLRSCIGNGPGPDPREVVFTLIPWAKRGPILRPDLWDRPEPA